MKQAFKNCLLPLGIFTVLVRFFHLFWGIFPHTGFSTSLVWDISVYGCILIFALFATITVIRSDEQVPSSTSFKPALMALILLAAVVLYVSIRLLLNSDSHTLLPVYALVSKITAWLGLVFAIALVFSIFSTLSAKRERTPSLVMCVLAILYSIGMLFSYYIKHDTVVTISQHLLGLLFWMSTVLFAYAYTRFRSHSKQEHSHKLSVLFGWLSSLLGWVFVLPQYIGCLINDYSAFFTPTSPEALLIIPTTLSVTLLTISLHISSVKEDPYEEDDNTRD